MSYYNDADTTVFVDNSPQAKFRRALVGTDFEGRTIRQMVLGFGWMLLAMTIWLGCMIALVFNSLWLIAAAFITITAFESKLPGQLKFAGDAAFLALCVAVSMAAMPMVALLLCPITYIASGLAHKNLYGSFWHQQRAYWKGMDSSDYRRKQLGLEPKK